MPVANEYSLANELLPLLQQLDQALAKAIAIAQKTYGIDIGADPNRGLYISDEDVKQLLAQESGQPLFQIHWDTLPELSKQNSRLTWLKQQYQLTDFDLALLIIALAPEIDLRYERLYAYLQDDVNRKRPGVDLALNLLCTSSEEKLRQRRHLTADAPLISHGLLTLRSDPNQISPPFLAHSLKLDEQIIRFLLGQHGLDQPLIEFCQLFQPHNPVETLPVAVEIKQALQHLLAQVRQHHHPLKLYLQGVSGIGKRHIAAAIAQGMQKPLLIADLNRAIQLNLPLNSLVSQVFQAALLQQSVLYLPGVDQLDGGLERQSEQKMVYLNVLELVSTTSQTTILSGSDTWVPTVPERASVQVISLDVPDSAQRYAYWLKTLISAGISLDTATLSTLAERFRLTPEQIANAVVVAQSTTPIPQLSDLMAAARGQSGHDLQALVTKMQLRYRLQDIVLTPDSFAQLQEICQQVKYRQRVYGSWGFDRKLSLGKGVNVLFSGPPGTGKTMAAEVIANELQLDLYRIDLSQIVSKYIGETEKNLDRIFRAAETANAILFFDEADALFGKRSEVKDAHDRYANIEIGYLLQKMEEYEGIAILATNLRQNLDEAFVRRLSFIVEFPFPDEEYRCRILRNLFPAEAPLDKNIDFGWLAQEIRLAGGNLKNIVLMAAFYAAGEDANIGMHHIIQAAKREHQKIGRTWHISTQPQSLLS